MSNERTNHARRNRGVYNAFTGFRLEGQHLDLVQRLADLLNVDVSDILRGMVCGIAAIVEKSEHSAKLNSPTTSDKIRYV